MTTQTNTIHTNTINGHGTSTNALLDAISTAIGGVMRRLAENSRGGRCAREYQRLSDLSDAELARIGLDRDGIALRAFGPIILI